MFPDTAAATEFMATVNTPEAADCLTTTYTAGIAGALGPRRNVDDVVLTGEAEIVVDDIAEMPWWDDLAGEVTVIAVTIPVEFNEGRSRSSAWTEFGFVQAGRAVAALEWGGEGGRGMTWGDLPLVRSKLTAIDSTFPAGTNPDTMAFDGSSLWIANIGDDTVSKMNPADGSRVDYPTESRPNDVVFDGTNIWVVSTSGQTLSKFDTADGTRVDYETDGNPVAVTWDGTNIWVANCAGDTVSKFDPADGTRVDYEVGADPEGIRGTRTGVVCPQGLTFDGTSIWATNFEENTVSKINPADGTRVEYETGAAPWDVAFDGTNIWVTNFDDDTVSKIDPTDGSRNDIPVGNQPYEIIFDGTSIWVTNQVDATVSQINPADNSWVNYATGATPRGVEFDGTHIWVANGTDNTVVRITPS